jgi:hypothetical protein
LYNVYINQRRTKIMGGVVGGIAKGLPLIGSGLGLVSKIGGGISGLFKTKGAKKAQQFFGGMGSVADHLGGSGYQFKEGVARAKGLAQGAQNMAGRGREAINYGREFAGGMRDAFRNRDFGGMMNRASEGIDRFGQMGRGMVAEGRNMYDQGRQAYNFGRGVYGDVRSRYESGQNTARGRQGPANGITSGMLQDEIRRRQARRSGGVRF